ncbi:MAG TPA: NAD(P)H-hydrate dehydratase [Candidatus Omnitrophota bacterium]|nr:NAD(P)H-hydrate dehydratase [Candidatus Omnitrophota bacterium]
MRLPAQLLRRKADAHKRDFGHIFMLAGSRNMPGAAILCAKAAMRSGAGLVTVGLPEDLSLAIPKKIFEVMTLPLPQTEEGTVSLKAYSSINTFLSKVDVLVVGPGLSQNASTKQLARKIVSQQNELPVVIDADGLNALVGHVKRLKGVKILTPHPGEMARLLGTSTNAVQKNRKNIALGFAKKYNCLVVLKGNRTVVADAKGKVYINNTGNPGMATAGSGDVLTGIIASFLAQGLKPFDAAKYAVYIHGLAGDLTARKKTELGMIASDIIEELPRSIKMCA